MGKSLLESVDKGTEIPRISDSFYSCLDCQACLYVCPAGVNPGKVSLLSREIITGLDRLDRQNRYARMIATTTTKFMNPLGLGKQTARWADGISFEPKAEYLLYTGNMFQIMPYSGSINRMRKRFGKRLSEAFARIITSFPRLIKITSRFQDRELERTISKTLRNIVSLLQSSGISMHYLGANEPYPGTFLYDLGYLKEFKDYARRVYQVLYSTGIKKVITVDPHTYDLLRNVFPEYIENFDLKVYHYLDLLESLSLNRTDTTITFHEPCHFVLREPRYEQGLKILKEAADVRLPSRSGDKTRCCGGPNELTFPEIAAKVSNTRYEELKNTGAELVVTACPVCFANLSKEGDTVEIADFLVSRLVPEDSG